MPSLSRAGVRGASVPRCGLAFWLLCQSRGMQPLRARKGCIAGRAVGVRRYGHDRNNPWHPPSVRDRFSLCCRDSLSSPLDGGVKRFQSVGPGGLTDGPNPAPVFNHDAGPAAFAV